MRYPALFLLLFLAGPAQAQSIAAAATGLTGSSSGAAAGAASAAAAATTTTATTATTAAGGAGAAAGIGQAVGATTASASGGAAAGIAGAVLNPSPLPSPPPPINSPGMPIMQGVAIGLAVAAVVNAMIPNWSLEDFPIGDNIYRITLRKKSFAAGGEGEAWQLFKYRAERIAAAHSCGGYQILEYTEGLESGTFGAQKVGQGLIRCKQVQ